MRHAPVGTARSGQLHTYIVHTTVYTPKNTSVGVRACLCVSSLTLEVLVLNLSLLCVGGGGGGEGGDV